MLAWVETDRTVRVVLDAVDLTATSAQYYEDYPELVKTEESAGVGILRPKLSGTYSFHRFGLNTDDIYCTVQGRGTYYKTTAKKQSNSEHTYFGSARYSGIGRRDVRGLYGFKRPPSVKHPLSGGLHGGAEGKTGYEGLKTADHVTYQLTPEHGLEGADRKWMPFATDTAKDDSNEVTEVKTEFQSIRQLRPTRSLKGMNAGRIRSADCILLRKQTRKRFYMEQESRQKVLQAYL